MTKEKFGADRPFGLVTASGCPVRDSWTLDGHPHDQAGDSHGIPLAGLDIPIYIHLKNPNYVHLLQEYGNSVVYDDMICLLCLFIIIGHINNTYIIFNCL